MMVMIIIAWLFYVCTKRFTSHNSRHCRNYRKTTGVEKLCPNHTPRWRVEAIWTDTFWFSILVSSHVIGLWPFVSVSLPEDEGSHFALSSRDDFKRSCCNSLGSQNWVWPCVNHPSESPHFSFWGSLCGMKVSCLLTLLEWLRCK